jgi:thiamine kinase-like enzyme
LWLVDWEAAFQNDRYAELAVVANMLVANEEEETIYLEEYLGARANSYQAARLYLMRQLAHMFYAMAFLTLGSPGKLVDRSEPCSHTTISSVASGHARSAWQMTARKPFTAGFIWSSSGTTCANQDSRKLCES